jgi:protein-disulfide isomerase
MTMTSQTDPSAAGQGPSRKERRAAERSARKSGSPLPSTSQSSGRSMWLITGAAIAIALLAIVGLVAISGGFEGQKAAAVSKPDVPAPAQELRVGRSLGDPEAPVRIDVFEDPQCPACGLYTERIEPLLIAGPVTDGQVFLTYKDLPFIGQESLDAAVAMRVAEEMDGKFWDYHALVFHNQEGENKGAFTLDRLADMAELLDLDRETFLTEMKDPAYLEAVQAEAAEGAALDISSTPSVVVNGEVLRGVPEWAGLKERIAAAASGTAGGG